MTTTTKVAQWLKEQVKPKKQPKLIIIMIGKKQLLSNQLYEGTGND